jgi:hypothetical protein
MKYTKDEIKKMVTRYVALRKRQAEIETEMKLIKSALIECLEEVPDKKMEVGKRVVSVSDCSKKTISFATLYKEHPKIAEKFASVSAYKQLNVK